MPGLEIAELGTNRRRMGITPAMATTDAARWFEHEAREYSGAHDRPLGGYGRLMAAYGASVLGLGALAAATKRPLPEHLVQFGRAIAEHRAET